MFDFPASPSFGDVFQGANGAAWQWDGEKWNGGAPAVQSDEQFIQFDGLTTFDVTVPTWAKGCTIEGSLFMSNANAYPGLQVSVDGSTFLSAANSYQLSGGPYHYVAGTAPYGTQGNTAAPWMYLGYQVTNLNVPQNFIAHMNLVATVTNQIISLRAIATAYSNAANTQTFNMTWHCYCNTTATSVKKIRLLATNGYPAAANSWVKIKWHGDQTQLPAGAGVLDAPSDGAEYVRVNGVWRKKCETFTWASRLNVKQIICPAGATRLTARIFVANAVPQANGSLGFQVSFDGGSTWNSQTNAYYYYGVSSDSGSANALNAAVTGSTFAYLGWMTNNTSVGTHSTADISLTAIGSSTRLWHAVGGGYYDTGSFGRTWVINGYGSAGFSAGPVNALQFFLASSNMDGGSIECTWGYG